MLNDYADAIAGAVSPQERMRLATEAFGKSGGPMINLLKGGSAGLADFARQANDAGLVLAGPLARHAEGLNDRLGVLEERTKVASATLVLSLTPAIEAVLGVYERFSIGTSNLIAQFTAINNLGLGPLEERAESLRSKIALLEKTNPGDWFGTLSGARAELAAVEEQIARIRNGGGVAPTSNGGVVDDLLPPEGFTRANDNLDELRSSIFAASGALEAFGSGGRDALSAFEAHTDLVGRAEQMADAYNRSNKAAIDSGHALARSGKDYLPLLENLADLEERRADALRVDDIVAKLGEEERFARTRLELGEAEARIQQTINGYRADGIEINADLEAKIRGSVAETERLNKVWEKNRERIKEADKAAAEMAADRSGFPDDFTEFDHLIMEALSCPS